MTLLQDRLQRGLVGRYAIDRELGRGGMATVYLADDLRHRRQVALKVLAPELASAIGTGRFLREIAIAGQLVHPHIVPLFESGVADGLLFYAMPVITGGSLRTRLSQEGALAVEEVVRIAREVGSALNFAHRHGFVHRDVKPENILFQDGRAYVADFGLARVLSDMDQEQLTNTGLYLGTPAYMSPEQASGDKRLDQRSDVYSLGSVVYEMLAGEPPFEGSVRAVIARVLTEQPLRLGAIRPTIPEAVSEVVSRAMAKVPADRYRSAEEFVHALELARTRPAAARWRRWRYWRRLPVAAAVAGAVLAGGGFAVLRRGRAAPDSAAINPRVERQLTYSGHARGAVLSPDGTKAAYFTQHPKALVVRDLDTGDSTALAADTSSMLMDRALEWNRDGTRLLYYGTHPTGLAYYSVQVPGGRPVAVALTSADLHFGADDSTWVATLQAALYVGGAPTTFQLLSGDSLVGDGTLIDLGGKYASLWFARMSPDGRWIAVLASRPTGEVDLLAVGRDGRRTMLVGDLGLPSNSTEDWSRPLYWSTDSRTLYYPRPQGLGWSVWSLAFDPRTGAAQGPGRLFAERLPSPFSFGVSADGRRLVYSGGPTDIQLVRFQLDRRGQVESTLELTAGAAMHEGPDLSPDGSQVAYVRKEQDGRTDLFLLSIEGGVERRLTSTGSRKGPVAWSPDGKSIAYLELHRPTAVLMVVDVTSGRASQLGRGPGEMILNERPPVWLPDGRAILYQTSGSRNYFVVERATGAERRLVRDESVGWLSQLVVEPSGRGVAALWMRPPRSDLWYLGLNDGTQRRIPGEQSPGPPIRWGQDSLLYLEGWVTETSGGAVRTNIHSEDPVTGRRRLFAQLPVACLGGSIALSADARTVVCPAVRNSSDVWLSEASAAR